MIGAIQPALLWRTRHADLYPRGRVFALAVASGILGLGVAFAAVPFLGLFLPDLVHQVQPLSLVLNAVTALFSTFGFARSGHLIWKQAIALAVITAVTAPIGAYLAQDILSSTSGTFTSPPSLAYRLLRPGEAKEGEAQETARGNLKAALILAVPISIRSGLLGVGPGFLRCRP